jgi:site-specific recombinase XerD
MAAEQAVTTLAAAIDAFLARADLAASSRRSYAQTLRRLAVELGADRRLGDVADELGAAVGRAWGGCAPATWNRHVATTRSFVAFCGRRGWLSSGLEVRVERRREPADRTRAIAYVQIDRLWRRGDVAIREKALWLLYETAARASEVLSLNVEDLDLENRRAAVRSKGGDIELLHFQTGSARLLPRLIAGRTHGPLSRRSRGYPRRARSSPSCA